MHRNIQKRVGGQKPEFGNCLESTYNVILHKYTTTHRPRRTHTHITGHSHLQLFYSIRVIFNNKLYYTENFLSFQPNIRSFTIAYVCARFLVVYKWKLILATTIWRQLLFVSYMCHQHRNWVCEWGRQQKTVWMETINQTIHY